MWKKITVREILFEMLQKIIIVWRLLHGFKSVLRFIRNIFFQNITVIFMGNKSYVLRGIESYK
jgi:hypothetical protein